MHSTRETTGEQACDLKFFSLKKKICISSMELSSREQQTCPGFFMDSLQHNPLLLLV